MEYKATNSKDFTIKEIAKWLGVNPKSVHRNRKRWGLDKARYYINKRVVRYRYKIVIRELLRMRLIEKD